MKSIKLTEDHKSKLLEMCKNLFPEQEFYWEYEMYGRGLKEDFNDVLQVYFKDKEAWKRNLFPFNIHWFEFCMTHLANKVIYLETKKLRTCQGNHEEMLMQLMKNFYDEKGTHPVDYLYSEFLKLSK